MSGTKRPGGWLGLLLLSVGMALALAGAVRASERPSSAPEATFQQRLDPHLRLWLGAQTRWRVGVVREWLPIDGVDAAGRHTGVSAEVLDAAATLLGVQIEVQPYDDFNQAVAAVREGRLDLLSATARTTDRERHLSFSQAYLSLPVAYITRRAVTDFSETDDFGGRTVAVERGYVADELLKTRFPQVRRLEVASTAEALRAVAEGRADVYRGALTPAHYLIERERLADLRVADTVQPAPTELAFASAEPALVACLDAALRDMGPARLAQIAQRWQPRYLSLSPARPLGAASVASASGLGTQDELRVVYDAGFAPVSHARPDGAAEGLALEMFRRSADAAGLRYRLIAKPNFASAIQAIRDHDADVLAAAVRTPERLRDGLFVGPYYSAPSAIVSRLDGGWPTLTSLAGHRLAIDTEHYLIPIIRREAPGVDLRVLPSTAAVLKAVNDGQADAGVTNVEVAAGFVATRYAGRLHVSGLVEDHPSELYFMVRADRPAVAQALAAGYAAVPENERRTLANAQLRTNITSGTDWGRVALVVVPVVLGLTALWLTAAWSARRLRASQALLREERDRAHRTAQQQADLVADVSHEVRTPLVALAEGLRLLQRQGLPPLAQAVLRPLVAAADRLVELLNTLLDGARLDAGRLDISPRPTDVAQLVQTQARAFEPMAAAKGVALRIEVAPSLPLLMLDPHRTQQVLNNLVSNAIKFTDEGEVSVELRAEPRDAATWAVALTVRDSGPGMSTDEQDQLFGRFTQAPGVQRQRGGAGLGLAITRRLVEHAGGRIEVTSQPGQGSVFTVHVLAEAAGHTEAPARQRQLNHVLLVDDDPVNQLVFAERLRQRGFDVQCATDTRAARRCLGEQPVDLLLTDWNLAEGTSQALIDAARAPTRRIVVLSGEEAPPELPAGVQAWLPKPQHTRDTNWLADLERIAEGA